MPLLLILLTAMGVWYFLKGSEEAPEVAVQQPAPVEVKEPEPPARISTKVILADGTELNAYKGGIEDKLVACLSDSSCKPGKDLWFDFDNLNFDMGSAKITAESESQVRNIAAILQAYPKLKIKIGGYTDKTGNADANKKLSQDRAQATHDAIIAAGANAAQLEEPEGYGSEFATVPAEASEDDRRSDRRISVSVRAK
jgi:outer membrane protein OmpA-like peptidoglycan-associated protein